MRSVALTIVLAALGLASATVVQAAPAAFDFADPKGVNAVLIVLD